MRCLRVCIRMQGSNFSLQREPTKTSTTTTTKHKQLSCWETVYMNLIFQDMSLLFCKSQEDVFARNASKLGESSSILEIMIR